MLNLRNAFHVEPLQFEPTDIANAITDFRTDYAFRIPLPRTLPPPPNTPPIRTQKRSATILPNFVGIRFAIHNGKTYQEVQITEEMVGRKLGEYVAYVYPIQDCSVNGRSEFPY